MATKKAPQKTDVAKAASVSATGYELKTAQERHDQRMSWFISEASRQASNRAQMAKCEAYYDTQQYTHEDAKKLTDRGQDVVVYNEVAPIIDFLIGTERRQRVDFYVVAEDDGDEAEDDAQAKSKLLKYLDETNSASFERSQAAKDAFKAGIGWLEVGLRGDKSGVMVYIGAESWRNMLWDSIGGTKYDITNARYVLRIKVVDLDVAAALFPNKKEQLEAVAQDGDDTQVMRDWFNGAGLISGLEAFTGIDGDSDYMTNKPVDMFNPRKRVMLIECWSREPMINKESVNGLGDPVTFKIRVSIMTEKDTLLETWSPYKHDRFPFIPVWAYRYAATGLPYSPTIRLIGPQDALNDRMSRALFEAASNQTEIEKSAIDPEVMDVDEIHAELNDPNGLIVYQDGAISGGKVRKRDNAQAAQQQLTLAANDRMALRSMVGTDDRGSDASNMSGKARLVKADQTSVQTAELFDNILLARQIEGNLTLSLAEQFMVHEFTARVAGEAGKYERVKFNQAQENGGYLNDIAARKAHFVVGEQAWKQSFAESTFESLMQVMSQLAAASPQVVVALLDVVFDMHPNLPRKQAILKRIRSINGQQEDGAKLTPEQQAEQQQKAAVAKAQFEAQMAKIQADIKEAQNKGEKLDAETMMTRVQALKEAATAAAMLMTTAGTPVMHVADELLKSAGFKDQSGDANVIDQQALPQPNPKPQPMAAQPVAEQAAPQEILQ